MPSDTRQRLIDAAKQRFYDDGFRNVGIDAILAAVGISKSAFYKHFDSKDSLMVAVLDDVDRFLQSHFREMVAERGGRSAAGQLRALLDVVHHVVEQMDFHGCIFVNAVMEFPLPHDPAHQAAQRHQRALEEFVFALAERAGTKDPAAVASELCMVVEGAYVTRSVTGNPQTIAIARRLASQIIDCHIPGI
jgi:AcrR family transcriptional regulator